MTEPSPPLKPTRPQWAHVVAAALVAALHAVLLLGRLHPDEVFQSLEPALHRAFGFGVLSWEWQVGLRNQAVPIFFSWLLVLASKLGIDGVFGRRLVLEVPQLALHAAMLAAVWRLAARRAGATVATWSMWAVALYGPVVWFGGRTMSEAFSVAFIVCGLELLDREDDRRWHVATLGGVLLGLSVVARYGSAAVVAPAMVVLLAQRRFRAFGLATAGGLVIAALLGLLDRVTWGDWFHSFIAYVNFNVFSGQAAQQFGTLPWWHYVLRLVIAPWAVVGLFAWWRAPQQRQWLLFWPAVAYYAVITSNPHKEDRFLYPTLVLLTVAGTPAFVSLVSTHWNRSWAKGLAAAAVVSGALFFVIRSPWEPQRKEQFQLELAASRGATGFVLVNEGMWGSGGFFYLGQNLPWCACDVPEQPCFQTAAADRRFNRGVYWSNADGEEARDAATRAAFEAAGFKLVEQRGQASYFAR